MLFSPDALGAQISAIAADLHKLGLMQATSGNLSALLSPRPMRVVITPSGVSKAALKPADMVIVDGSGVRVTGEGRPSDELPIHLELMQSAGAEAVIHTHSVWATIVSRGNAFAGGVAITGFEMLKALSGVATHEHTEWVPILENTQDYDALRAQIADVLREHPQSHGLLLAGHGLYSWGKDLREARRHCEAFEFLFEVLARAGGA